MDHYIAAERQKKKKFKMYLKKKLNNDSQQILEGPVTAF